MPRLCYCLVAFIGFHFVANSATAAVISADDPVFGVGALTRDTVQGLDFLDLTFSTNRSISDVSTEFGSGGDFDGFRYATEFEVVTLINNYGFLPGALPNISVTGNTGADQLSGLVSLLSATLVQVDSQLVYGTTSTLSSGFPGNNMAPVIVDFLATSSNDVVSSQTVTPTYAANYIGSYLVKASPPAIDPPIQPVPEPSSFLLICTLLATQAFAVSSRGNYALNRSSPDLGK